MNTAQKDNQQKPPRLEISVKNPDTGEELTHFTSEVVIVAALSDVITDKGVPAQVFAIGSDHDIFGLLKLTLDILRMKKGT